MKSIILSITLLALVSCGKSTTSGLSNGGTTTDTGGTTITTSGGVDSSNVTVNLVAIKQYTPVQTTDGVYSLSEGYNVSIPSSLEVVNGNAGNWIAELHFDSLICYYKGGSSMTNPLYTGNQVELTKGKTYNFTHCSDGVSLNTGNTSGNSVYVMSAITLRIKNGDSQAQTKVALNLLLIK